jgi:hypothetical protein
LRNHATLQRNFATQKSRNLARNSQATLQRYNHVIVVVVVLDNVGHLASGHGLASGRLPTGGYKAAVAGVGLAVVGQAVPVVVARGAICDLATSWR